MPSSLIGVSVQRLLLPIRASVRPKNDPLGETSLGKVSVSLKRGLGWGSRFLVGLKKESRVVFWTACFALDPFLGPVLCLFDDGFATLS